MLRKFLLEQIHQGVVVSVLLEVRAGDAGGIVLRGQIVELADLSSVLTLGDGAGVADLGGISPLRRVSGGSEGHSQRQCQGADCGQFLHRRFLLYIFISGSGGASWLWPSCWRWGI